MGRTIRSKPKLDQQTARDRESEGIPPVYRHGDDHHERLPVHQIHTRRADGSICTHNQRVAATGFRHSFGEAMDADYRTSCGAYTSEPRPAVWVDSFSYPQLTLKYRTLKRSITAF